MATGMFATLDAWAPWAQEKEGEEVARWRHGWWAGWMAALGALSAAGGGDRRRERRKRGREPTLCLWHDRRMAGRCDKGGVDGR